MMDTKVSHGGKKEIYKLMKSGNLGTSKIAVYLAFKFSVISTMNNISK